MADKPDGKRWGRAVWCLVFAVSPVLYLLLIGPVFWFAEATGNNTIVLIYVPYYTWMMRWMPQWLLNFMDWYLKWWI